MKKMFFLVVMLFTTSFIWAQKQTSITITELSESEGKIFIKYDIDKNMPEESFDIKVVATHTNDEPITVLTCTGDVGKNISGGKNKQIIWEFEHDGVFLNENIKIKLSANKVTDVNYYSVSKLIIASTILPGKGVNMLDRSKGYLPWTVMGYGFAGTSLLFAVSSKATYNDYLIASTISDRDKFYSKYKNQTTIAGLTALSAVGVWGFNYYRIFLTKNKIIKNQNSLSNWYFYPSFFSETNTNMLTLSVKF